MALQDVITNLGTAIINLVNVKITKAFTIHDYELEEILLELKTKVDALVENSGSTDDVDEPGLYPSVMTETINGLEATVTVLKSGSDVYTTYEFTEATPKISGTLFLYMTYDEAPSSIVIVDGESSVEYELSYTDSLTSSKQLQFNETQANFNCGQTVKIIKFCADSKVTITGMGTMRPGT